MTRATLRLWARALRVDQWTKSGVVLLVWFFAVADAGQPEILRGARSFLMALAMAVSFALVSSAFYLFNDVADCEDDRRHPVKRQRPVAADLISRKAAVRAALVLLAGGLAFPAAASTCWPPCWPAFGALLAYALLQCLYTRLLKRIAYLDVVTLAAGFVLRAVSGAAIVGALVSPWLLGCTFALATFLAFCKRKHELETAADSRAVLRHYHPKLLRACIFAAAFASAAVYVAWAFLSRMVAQFPYLWTTSFFVLAGLARYTFLARTQGDTGRPEKVLLSDRLLWVILVGYALAAIASVAVVRTPLHIMNT